MRVRIFQQPKSAMQSGQAGTQEWIIEWAPSDRRVQDPLMGWFGSSDTQSQVRLSFDTREAAIAYAEKHGLDYDVELPPVRIRKPKAYADNFKFGRIDNWTH
jgi:hypothetical protein